MREPPSIPAEGARFEPTDGPPRSEPSAPAAATRGVSRPEEQPTLLARARATPVTFSVIATCTILQLLAYHWGRGSDDVLWDMGANNGEAVFQGEVYRLLACTFLHGGLLHLFMNMFVLLALSSLEVMLGWRRFLVLYALSGLAGSLATALYSPETPSVGASGAIWGVMMATFGFRFAARRVLALRGVKLTAGMSTLLVNVAISFLPGVDTTAHFGGGLAGFLLGALVLRPGWTRQERPVYDPRDGKGLLLTAAAALAALLMAASVVVAFAAGEPWRYADVPAASRIQVGHTPLSLALPEVLGTDLKHDTQSSTYTYGSTRRVPIVLAVEPLELSSEPELSPDAVIDAWHEAMREAVPEDGVKRTSLQVVALGGRRVIREESLLRNDRSVLRYDAFVPGYRVVLVFWRRAPEPVWTDVEEQIVASLRSD